MSNETIRYTGPFPQTETECVSMTYGPNGVVCRHIEKPSLPPPKPPPPPFPPLDTPADMQLATTELAVKVLTRVDDSEDLLIDCYEWAEQWLVANKLATKEMLEGNKPADGDAHIRLNRQTGKCELTESWDDE